MGKWPANLASNSSLLLGTILFVEGTNVQQGQWTLILSPRFLSKGEKDYTQTCSSASLSSKYMFKPPDEPTHLWMPSTPSQSQWRRQKATPPWLEAQLFWSRCTSETVLSRRQIWESEEKKHKLIWLTYSFYFLHCTAWETMWGIKPWGISCRHSLLIFGMTQAFCLEKPHAILSPGIFPHAALWCAPVGLALWRCEILLWPKYWNFAPRWWRRSPLSGSTGSEEPGWSSLWNKSRIHFGLIYTWWSVRGFQRVNLKEIKLALVPKQQM